MQGDCDVLHIGIPGHLRAGLIYRRRAAQGLKGHEDLRVTRRMHRAGPPGRLRVASPRCELNNVA